MKRTTLLFLSLFIYGSTIYGQIDLNRHKPDISPELKQTKQYRRLIDQDNKRDPGGVQSRDWARWKAWEKLKSSNFKTAQIGEWENPGPDVMSGRLISIAFHPTDSNVLYVGAASGGLWRSEDYGQSWDPLTDDYPTMGVGAVAINPQNPQSLIIATGEGYGIGNEFTGGFGILVSHNGGQTWDTTHVTAGLSRSFSGMDIVWNPNDTNKVCVATSFGIYFSGDGGTNYTTTLARVPARMVADPQHPDTLYLSAKYFSSQYRGGFYRSYDAGQTWNLISGTGLPGATGMGYASIAVHPVYTNQLFLNVSQSTINGNGPMQGLYKSNDYGSTWTQIQTNVDLHCYPPPYGNICQGWYDNTIVCSPADTNVLLAGGTRLWKSTDGGFTWLTSDLAGSPNGVHADHHQTVFHPLTGDLFDCNDGGIDYSVDEGTNWASISAGITAQQFYTIASAQTDPNVVIGGTQDVGTFSSVDAHTGGNWEHELGGDSFGTQIDPQNKEHWYTTSYLTSQRLKSGNSGLSWVPLNAGTGNADQWRMPLEIDPGNRNNLLSTGGGVIFKSYNAGLFWSAVTTTIGDIGMIAYSTPDPDRVFASRLWGNAMFHSTDGGDSWMFLPGSPGGPITDLATDLIDPDKLYATMGSYSNQHQVYVSYDGGLNWTNLSANLPSVPANSLVIDPFDNENLYVGTDLGVFVSEDGGGSWAEFNNGLPYVPVDDMHYYAPDSTLRIGTYGRGYWRAKALEPTITSGRWEAVNTDLMTVYPNPVKGGANFTVRAMARSVGKASVTVTNQLGQQLSAEVLQVHTGINELRLTAPEAPGVYFVSLEMEGRGWVTKVVVSQ